MHKMSHIVDRYEKGTFSQNLELFVCALAHQALCFAAIEPRSLIPSLEHLS
jgi:hypothetical protein